MAAALPSTSSRDDLLNQAIKQLEEAKELQGYSLKYSLACDDHVHLHLENRDISTFIGIIHTFEKTQRGKVEKTVDKIAQAILLALKIHEEVKNRPDFVLNSDGVPFYIGNHNIRIDDEQRLVIDGKIVTQKINGTEKAVNARCFLYEKGVYFEESETGFRVSGCHFTKKDDGRCNVSPCQDPAMPEFLINDRK